MRPEELASRHPRLYHMSEAGSWETIRELGLLTTAQMVDLCRPEPAVREAVLDRRRTTSHVLHHSVHGRLVVRDQGPLVESRLAALLVDMTVAEWLHELNTRAFFWVDEAKLVGLLSAKLYGGRAHDVLVLDTARLLAAHADRVRLTTMNTGATTRFANCPRRGRDTFMTIPDFPLGERRTTCSQRSRVVELAVTGGVPDVADLVERVERRRGPDAVTVLWERPGR